MSNEKVKDRGRVKAVGYFIVAMLLVGGLGFGGGFQYALATTTAGTWDGNYITELYGNFTTGLRLAWIATGRVLYTTTGGAITSNAAFTFISNVLNVPNAVISGTMNATDANISGTTRANDLIITGDTNSTDNYISRDIWIQNSTNAYINATDPLIYPEIEPDYLLWKSFASYFAKESLTGKVTRVGNDGFSDLWQDCHDSLPTGGRIHCLNNLFTITKTLNMTYSGIVFSGNSPFRGDDEFTDVQKAGLILGAAVDMIHVTGRKCLIESLYLDGLKATYSATTIDGIWTAVDTSQDLHMRDVYIGNFGGSGIILQGEAATLVSVYSEYNGQYGIRVVGDGNRLISCTESGNTLTGLYISSSDYNMVWGGTQGVNGRHGISIELSNYNTIMGTRSRTNGRAGISLTGSSNNVIEGAIIYDNSQETTNTYDGINISKSGATNSVNNRIISNSIYMVTGTTNKMRYCIAEGDANQLNNEICFNSVAGGMTGQILAMSATTQVHYNPGYVTENSGTFTLTSGTSRVTITHGLSGTPLIQNLRITLNGPMSNCTAIWIDPASITSTTFQVVCGTTAEKWTNANIVGSWSRISP